MNSNLSSGEAWALFHEAGCPEWVTGHVDLVHGLAMAMAQKLQERGHAIDVELVSAGAILHDVGRAQTQDPTHAYLGGQWLRERGVPAPIVRIVARHTGAGLIAAEAKKLGLPTEDFVPVTLEEKVVAHADNLCSGPRRVGMKFLEKKYAAQGLFGPFARIVQLHEALSSMLGCNPEELVASTTSS